MILEKPSVANSNDFPDCVWVLDSLEHEICNVSARDSESERRQMVFANSVFPGQRLIGQPRRAHDCPIEPTTLKYVLHRTSVRYCSREKQTAENIGGWNDRVFEQKSH